MLLAISAILLMSYALFVMYVITAPAYIFAGPVEGYVAVCGYALRYYGVPLSLPALESVRFLVLPVLINFYFLMITSIVAIISAVRNNLSGLANDAILASGLVTIIALSLLLGILSVVRTEVSGLAVNNRYISSAGIVDFGAVTVQRNLVAKFIEFPLPIILFGLSVSSACISTYFAYLAGKQKQK